jgi:signal transduction histidine kinase
VKIPRPSAPTLVTCALLILLPTLAVLQYRWVGQVSVAERERMQRNLRNAAAQFREAFDGEVLRAQASLQVSALTAREGGSDRYTDRYLGWRDSAAFPQVVANIFVIDADGSALRVRRWNPETRVFDATDWVAPLERWRALFEQQHEAFTAGRPFDFDRRMLYRDEPSLLIQPLRPITTPPSSALGPSTITPVFGFTVIQLDMPFIRDRMIPALALRHFSHTDEGEESTVERSDIDRYRVAVTETAHPDVVLYRSGPESPVDPDRADAVISLLDPRSFGRGGFGGLGPGGSRPGGATGGRPDNAVAPEERPREDLSRWRLIVQHQSGSLDGVVAALRRRNLGISFGVLALLSVSVALLAVTSRRAQTLARQQMEFVAGVSHELRTPVAVIRSAGENLSQGVVGNAERVKQYGQMIEGEARRLGEMVERVLQYAGIASGLGFAARTPLSPAEVIDAAVKSEATLADNGLNVQREIAADLPPVVGDAAALRSVVQNLLANAVKYGGRDRWIGIKAELVRERRQPEVRITISDHGAGIPADELPHIFEPFYRGADALSRQVHGNGLGLSLVKRIVTAHGGHVSVSTRPGSGSAFTIALPAAEPDRTAVPAEAGVTAHS